MVLVHWPEFRETMVQGSAHGETRDAPNDTWQPRTRKDPRRAILLIGIDGLSALVRIQEIDALRTHARSRETMIQVSTQEVTRDAPNEYWDAQVQKRPQENNFTY